jgi:hypothetical protein
VRAGRPSNRRGVAHDGNASKSHTLFIIRLTTDVSANVVREVAEDVLLV